VDVLDIRGGTIPLGNDTNSLSGSLDGKVDD
jgi:hypothetical protein